MDLIARPVWAVLLAGGLLAGWGCAGKVLPPHDPADQVEEPVGPPFFEDVTRASGIDWTYKNGEEANHLAILESLGGGIGLIDYDGDGLLDVFVPGGGGYAGKDRKTIVGRPCKLYRNLGAGKFQDVTDRVLKLDGDWFYTHGCAVGDYDRDGWPDLLVTGWGRVALFRNEPVDEKDPTKGRRLVDVTVKAGLDALQSWSSSAGWADLDGDGYPDLYVCCYADWSFANHPSCTYDGKTPDVCPPKQFSGLPHHLFRNNKGRTFTDVSAEAGLHKGGRDASKGLGVLLVDVNGDGKPDIYVANDTVDNFLYINECTPGRFKFKEVGLVSGAARDASGSPNGSMGLDAGDPDGSGKPWLWVTNFENESHGLYRNECEGTQIFFNHVTNSSGINAIGQKFVAWGTGFVDLDHHGWEDLFIADGHAVRFPKTAPRRQRPVLLRNLGGARFKDVSRQGGPYFQTEHLARGAAPGDLDNDGRVDVVVSHINEPVAVLRNVARTDGNHWLGVQLVGRGHADVVGARVVLEAGGRKQTRFAKGGGSYASAPDRRHVFGLGREAKVQRVSVTWPDLKEEYWEGLAVDRYHRLEQGKGKPTPAQKRDPLSRGNRAGRE